MSHFYDLDTSLSLLYLVDVDSKLHRAGSTCQHISSSALGTLKSSSQLVPQRSTAIQLKTVTLSLYKLHILIREIVGKIQQWDFPSICHVFPGNNSNSSPFQHLSAKDLKALCTRYYNCIAFHPCNMGKGWGRSFPHQ